MNRWSLVAAAFVAAVVAAFFLRALPGIVVLILFVGGGIYVSTLLKRQAKGEVKKTGAEMLGLKREVGDPFGLLAFPLALMARTSEPRIDELVWGPWRGIDVTVFGLSFDAPTLPGTPPKRSAFACALAKVDAGFPSVVAEPQALLTAFERAPTGTPVEVGDPPFDRAWNVWSEDEGFARELMGPDMRDWLRSLGDGWGMEVHGKIAIVYGRRPGRPDVFAILEALKGLLDHIPTELRSAHPPTA
jgi:hypothetical protein